MVGLPAEVVVGNIARDRLAGELGSEVKKVFGRHGLMAAAEEMYARSRRPMVLFLRLRDAAGATRESSATANMWRTEAVVRKLREGKWVEANAQTLRRARP